MFYVGMTTKIAAGFYEGYTGVIIEVDKEVGTIYDYTVTLVADSAGCLICHRSAENVPMQKFEIEGKE